MEVTTITSNHTQFIYPALEATYAHDLPWNAGRYLVWFFWA
jgi:hypothetical protein